MELRSGEEEEEIGYCVAVYSGYFFGERIEMQLRNEQERKSDYTMPSLEAA